MPIRLIRLSPVIANCTRVRYGYRLYSSTDLNRVRMAAFALFQRYRFIENALAVRTPAHGAVRVQCGRAHWIVYVWPREKCTLALPRRN